VQIEYWGLKKMHQDLRKSEDKKGLNSLHTPLPNMVLKIRKDLGFNGNYLH
jgi:hypothetical protein